MNSFICGVSSFYKLQKVACYCWSSSVSASLLRILKINSENSSNNVFVRFSCRRILIALPVTCHPRVHVHYHLHTQKFVRQRDLLALTKVFAFAYCAIKSIPSMHHLDSCQVWYRYCAYENSMNTCNTFVLNSFRARRVRSVVWKAKAKKRNFNWIS